MKDIHFCGRSLEVLRGFSVEVKREAGYQLDRVQRGLEPTDWKAMPTIGSGVREIRISHEGQYRVIYVAKFVEAIYVLHVFQKKSQKTSKRDIDVARQAVKLLLNEE